MRWTNYHSHTHYCDGKGSAKDFIEQAIQLHMPSYGISSHNPLPKPVKWGMQGEQVDNYIKEVNALKKVYEGQIDIYTGMEVDYFDNMNQTPSFLNKLDYWIGSIHFIDYLPNGDAWEIDGSTNLFEQGLASKYNGQIKPAISRYFELMNNMIEKWHPTILGHLDKIKIHNGKSFFFDENDNWYLGLVDELLNTCKEMGTIVEVNTRGWYKGILNAPYPSVPILKMIHQKDIPIMLNSDSHHISEISGEFERCAKLLEDLGFKSLMVIKDRQLKACAFGSQSGILW